MKQLQRTTHDTSFVESTKVGLPKSLEQLSSVEMERKKLIARVTTCVLKKLTYKFIEEGFEWLLPVIFSKSTDPLWPDPSASLEKRIEVEIYGKTVRVTTSMIVHKMVACSLAYPKLFALSPNVRIEKAERAKSGLHTFEFTQLDFEVRYATSKDIRSFVEKTLHELVCDLKKDMKEELKALGRFYDLSVSPPPFKVYEREDLEIEYGKNWEAHVQFGINAPIWVTNIPREFYDFEDFDSGKWDNYDLILPEYGEVLSGGRREWEYNKIVSKMERDNVRKENFAVLLKLATEGLLKPSAGAGIGIERLIGWIVGARHVGEVQPFPKIPGVINDL